MGFSIVRDDNESLVNTSTSGTQQGPRLAHLAGGNTVVVWEDASGEGGDASGTSIKLRVFDGASGDPLGAEVLVNTSTSGNQDFPGIAALAGGGFVVVWHDGSGSGGDTSGTSVKAQRFDASGNRLGAELLVNTTTADAQAYASVAALAGGGFVVTWEDESQYGSNATDVRGQVFGADGTKSGAEFVVSTTVSADQWHPRVAGLADGGFAVSWYDFSGSSGDYSGSAIKLQLFSSGGAKLGSEIQVNTNTSGNQQYSSLVQLAGGNLVVVWEDASGSGGDASPPAIKGQLFSAAGVKIGGEFLVNTSTSSSQISPRVAALGEGFVVVWEDYSGSGGDASSSGIKAQAFDASGNKLGTETLVNAITASGQSAPDITALNADTFGVTWVDNSGTLGDASASGIVAQDLKLLQTPVVVADTATISEETGKASFFVLDNDSPLSTLSALGTITVSSTLAGLDAADLTASIVDDRIEVSFGNQFRHLASGQNATVVIPHTVTDGTGDSATTQLTITVLGANTLAPATPVEGEFRVNITLDDIQTRARTTLLADGSFIVVWEDYSSNFGDPDSAVVAQRFYSDGARMGGEFLVSPAGPGGATFGEAAALPGGGFMIVWEDHSSAHPDADGGIIGQVFLANGDPSGLPFLVNTTTTGPQYEPRTTVLQNGNIVVTWISTPDGFFGSMDVFAQILTPGGAPVGSEFAVQTQSAQGQLLPTIATLSNGNFVITWTTRDPAADGSDAAVKAQIFGPSGVKLGGEFLVNTTSAGFQSRPNVEAFDDGGFVIAWHSAANSGDAQTFDIRAQRYDNLGNKVGTEFLVNTTTSGFQGFPAVATLADGRFVISWTDASGRHGDGSAQAVVAQLFDVDGSKQGGEFLVNVTTSGDQQGPTPVTRLDDGRFLITWTDAAVVDSGNEQADPANIKARFYTLAQTTDGNDIVDMSGPGGGTVFGGPGDDIYIVDDPLDNPVEGPGEGRDTVRASINWKLGPSFEVLELTGSGTLVGWGNTGSNTVVGNGAANELYGEDTPDWRSQRGGADTLIGGAGNDRYFVDNPSDIVMESNAPAALRPAAWRFGELLSGEDGRPYDLGDDADTIVASLGRAVLAAFVENGVLEEGTSAREAIGNELANDMTGNAAGNLFQGAIGNDTLRGGDGVDVATYSGNRSEYTISQDFTKVTDNLAANGNEGTDTLTGIEVLRFADQVVALGGTTLVQGGAENDPINLGAAGGQAGAGGAGDDTYTVNATGDAVIEYAGGGTDTVRSSVSWTLWEHVEHLELTGNAVIDGAGNTEANRITGNSAANVLFGYQGNDTLEGLGGADTLLGGTGDDLYLADGSDTVSEFANEGVDTVQSAASFTLGNNLEVLELTGTTAANGTGNSAANRLTGNAGANTLAGAEGNDTLDGGEGNDSLDGGTGDDSLDGGPGTDTLAGGDGNDTFVASAGDVHVESAGGGSDTVRSALSWTLGSNIEKLVLTGKAAVNGTGNAGSNVLIGNAAANRLNGGAGNDTLNGAAGRDTLAGGGGNDTYIASTQDTIVELRGGGTDTVQSKLSWTLAANVEKLVLTGSKAINGTGSSGNNTLTGNGAGNVLSGLGGRDILFGQGGNDVLKGGAGNDRLFGGPGADVFVFDAALNASSNFDVLPDFDPAQDVIHLENAVFTALAAGALSPGQFRAGANLSAAQDADDRIVYDTATGRLYYDADGAGGSAAIRFANLGSEDGIPTLTAADFLVT